jgi:hypothetical protein
VTFELAALQEALDAWGEELHSRQGKFALIGLSAEIRVLAEQDPMTVANFLRFNKSVESIMRQVAQAERDFRADVLAGLERQKRERDEARADFGAIEGRNLQ